MLQAQEGPGEMDQAVGAQKVVIPISRTPAAQTFTLAMEESRGRTPMMVLNTVSEVEHLVLEETSFLEGTLLEQEEERTEERTA